MIISMEDKRGVDININLGKITQLIGQNGEKKEEIIDTIKDNFKKTRGKTEDKKLYVDDQLVGSSMFSLTTIDSMSDIKSQLTSNKSSQL